MMFYLAALQNIDRSIYEAARIDGVPAWARFRYITIPMLKPVILFTTVISTIGTLQLFDEVNNITAGTGGPSDSTLTLSLYIYNLTFKFMPSFGYAATVSWVIVVMVGDPELRAVPRRPRPEVRHERRRPSPPRPRLRAAQHRRLRLGLSVLLDDRRRDQQVGRHRHRQGRPSAASCSPTSRPSSPRSTRRASSGTPPCIAVVGTVLTLAGLVARRLRLRDVPLALPRAASSPSCCCCCRSRSRR